MLIFNIRNAPDAADEQFRMGLHRPGVDEDLLDPEIGESRLVGVLVGVQVDADLVDDLPSALFPDVRPDQARLIAMDIVLAQDILDGLNPRLDRGLIAARNYAIVMMVTISLGHGVLFLGMGIATYFSGC
jgi:hypothetical protein